MDELPAAFACLRKYKEEKRLIIAQHAEYGLQCGRAVIGCAGNGRALHAEYR